MDQDSPLMDLATVRTLLKRAKKVPVPCAVGIGPNNVGLLLLHKKRMPKALEKELRKEVPDAKGTRWGTASVDVARDAKLVKLSLNKSASGMAQRLVRSLKGTGFNKVEVALQ